MCRKPFIYKAFGGYDFLQILKIPVNFNGHISRTRNTFTDHDLVDENLHRFTCQVLNVDELLDQLTAVVSDGNFLLCFADLLLEFDHLPFKMHFL